MFGDAGEGFWEIDGADGVGAETTEVVVVVVVVVEVVALLY